jgi:protein-disulfide isomerase
MENLPTTPSDDTSNPNASLPTPPETGAPGQGTRLSPWLVGGAIAVVVCGALSLLLLVVLNTMGPFSAETFSQIDSSLQSAPTSAPVAQPADNGLGNPNAPVKIVEYADYQCPYCANFWRETEQQLITNYVDKGKVYLVFRSFGPYLGPESGRAAQAAYCAGDQGKFWKYHDTLFAHQAAENSGAFADDKLMAFATVLGLNVEQFGGCLRSNKYESWVARDRSDGKEAGVDGTPTFVVNGKQLIVGAQPYDAFVTAIEAILSKQ